MNIKIVLLSVLSTAVLMTSATAMAQHSVQTTKNETVMGSKNSSTEIVNLSANKQFSSSSQRQETTVNLDSANLRSPHTLEITATAGSRLSGQITVDGVVIQRLKQNRVVIDLAPYLAVGRKVVEISGRYQPTTTSIQLEFSGPDTTIMQQTSGSGLLQQVLVFEVE
ncbi:MAG: hypothetical protein F6K19_35695 [Cyanothece sp. SIO1E1]|nr:hypothetical protein [Cyanothece sp. SIO1E1]